MNTATVDLSTRKDWRGALHALRCLLADANDTTQVFRIMRALNAGSAKAGYDRLLRTPKGGGIAYRRAELAELFADASFLAQFAPGSLGAAYRDFLERTGYSAKGLADISLSDDPTRRSAHPYAWFGRRVRDVHDIWHILTGYRADDPLGEACLVAFSYAQTGGMGWAFIAIGAMLKALRSPSGTPAARAIWQGYQNGRRAEWLPGEDYEDLFHAPLYEVRKRLSILPATRYRPIGTA